MEKKGLNYVSKGLLLGMLLGFLIGILIPIEGEYYLSLVGRAATTSLQQDILGWKDGTAILFLLVVCFAAIGSLIGAIFEYLYQRKLTKKRALHELIEAIKREEEEKANSKSF